MFLIDFCFYGLVPLLTIGIIPLTIVFCQVKKYTKYPGVFLFILTKRKIMPKGLKTLF